MDCDRKLIVRKIRAANALPTASRNAKRIRKQLIEHWERELLVYDRALKEDQFLKTKAIRRMIRG